MVWSITAAVAAMAAGAWVAPTGPSSRRTADVAIGRSDAGGRRIAAVYARFSTRFQHSLQDQTRECKKWAEANGYVVPEEFVFTDEAKRGGSSRRSGLQALEKAIAERRVDAVVVFATNRLFRKTYRSLQFVHEEIVGRGIRCVFVSSGIDTAKKDDWETRLQFQAIVDEYQVKMAKAHVQSAQTGLFLSGKVFGTVTYGYGGEDIPGERTKLGKPARRLVIDPGTSLWVKRIFEWYVVERLPMSAIVRRLNEQGVPCSPRCDSGRWTILAVRTVLTNSRYRGEWKYGRNETVWLNREDYARGVKRAEPLQTRQIEDLRIIDDQTWFKAQELKANSMHVAGRRPKDGDRRSRPKLLNGLLRCGYHDRPLVTGGSDGRSMLCPVCKETDGKLFSMLERRLATDTICGKIAEIIRSDKSLAGLVLAACQEAAEAFQKPDLTSLDELRRQSQNVTNQIAFVMDAPGKTDQDLEENRLRLGDLRSRRAQANAEIARLEAAAAHQVEVPSPEKVGEVLEDLAKVLTGSCAAGTEEGMAEAREVIERVTGGRIMVYQAGPPEAHHGWLRASFQARILALGAERFGAAAARDSGTAVEVEFRRSPVHEQIAGEVKKLWDEGLTYKQIAERVGWNRNIVAEAVAYWHESHGLPAPDGRHHLGRLKRPPCLAEQIADRVMEMVDRRVPIKDIAKQLGTSRNRVTEAIGIWHQRRNLPAPDGRALRKLRRLRRAS